MAASSSNNPKPLKIDTSVWKKTCCNLPFQPEVGCFVLYFPEGHAEHMGVSGEVDFSQVGKPILCMINSISYLGDPISEECFAKIKLQKVSQEQDFAEFKFPDDSEDGYFGRPLTKTHISDRLYVGANNNNVFTVGDVRMEDLSGKVWIGNVQNATPKPGFFVSGKWKEMVAEKGIISGDSVFLKRTSEGVVVSFRRKENHAATQFLGSKKCTRKAFLKRYNLALSGEEFRVQYFPNWVDYLVDPSYFEASKQIMNKVNIKVKSRNTDWQGFLTKVGTDALDWKSFMVRWDLTGSEVSINCWDVVLSPRD